MKNTPLMNNFYKIKMNFFIFLLMFLIISYICNKKIYLKNAKIKDVTLGNGNGNLNTIATINTDFSQN